MHDPVYVPQLGNLKSHRKQWASRNDIQEHFSLKDPKTDSELLDFVESSGVCGGGELSIDYAA